MSSKNFYVDSILDLTTNQHDQATRAADKQSVVQPVCQSGRSLGKEPGKEAYPSISSRNSDHNLIYMKQYAQIASNLMPSLFQTSHHQSDYPVVSSNSVYRSSNPSNISDMNSTPATTTTTTSSAIMNSNSMMSNSNNDDWVRSEQPDTGMLPTHLCSLMSSNQMRHLHDNVMQVTIYRYPETCHPASIFIATKVRAIQSAR